MIKLKHVKQKLIRNLLSKHFKKIVNVKEEWLDWNVVLDIKNRGRKVDIITYECGHQYWQEKNLNLAEGICDSCLMGWLLDGRFNLIFAKWLWKWWNNKRVRKFIHDN